MKQPYFSPQKFICFAILCFSFAGNSTAFAQKNLKADLNPVKEEKSNFLDDRKDWKEIPEKRSLYSSTFITPDGRTIIQHSELPLNFYNSNGQLVPVVTEPVFKNGILLADQQPYPVKVDQAGAVYLSQSNKEELVFSSDVTINGVKTISNSITQNNSFASIKNVFPGIDKEFEFRYNGVEYSYVLNQVLSLNKDLVIEEEVKLGHGKKIFQNELYGHDGKTGWMGALLIVDDNGNECGRMRGVVCYDANNKISLGEYVVVNEKGKQKIKMIISSAWLNDPSTKYPVTIDPLVTGPTATWGGGLIASCLMPSMHADSILVTIPAQITVTGFLVSGSYYADPFTTTVMSDGQMFFATSCDTTTVFTVSGPTGTSPGTGYLTAYDLRNPLTCCWVQNCNQQTFYLRMLLGRTQPGTGCNTTYLYHDPLGGYPFSAYVEGHTIESYSSQWNVTPGTLCSNVCNLNGTVYMRYGVPPYTISHPWMTGTITTGTALGCNFGSQTKQLALINPNCPVYCDTFTHLSVPPPVVTDACGNTISGLPTKTININQTPTISAAPTSVINCSGDPYTINLTPCIPGCTISWTGNGTSGTSATITDTILNNGSAQDSVVYSFTATHNGCVSAVSHATIKTDPLPAADFNVLTSPAIVGLPVSFSDNSNGFGISIGSYGWTLGDGTIDNISSPTHIYSSPGIYTVCLAVVSADGCTDSVCKQVEVIPASIVIPNIITPNGDGVNDVLYFKYLEFFGTNNLKIFNRWGKVVYEKNNYANDWNASGVTDGTYYFILTTQNEKAYTGNLTIIRGK